MPCSSRNSEVWNPSGRSWPIVCLMTRGPAEPITAPGSARVTSACAAEEADTPPVVGLVRTEMKGSNQLQEVLEPEGVGRAQKGVGLGPGALVLKVVEVTMGPDARVVAAVGTDFEAGGATVWHVHAAAPVALPPGGRRDLQLHAVG